MNLDDPQHSSDEEDDLQNRDAELRTYFREGLPVQRVLGTKTIDSIGKRRGCPIACMVANVDVENKVAAVAGNASQRRLPDGTTASIKQATQLIAAQPGVQQAIVNGIDKFSVVMPGLVKGLEEVAKIHPIVQGASSWSQRSIFLGYESDSLHSTLR